MRIVLVALFALLSAPALAQGWDRYDNARLGYSIDIPPGFAATGDSETGDGQAFRAEGRPIDLLVWGGTMTETFQAEVAQSMRRDQDAAWTITAETTTPRWARWSTVNGSRIRDQRMVLLCDGGSYAAFRTEYWVTDSAEMAPVVERLERSLRGSC